MIPWKLVGAFLWKWGKALAPAIAILLALVLVYRAGASHAVNDLAAARALATSLGLERDQARLDRDQARTDLAAANLRILEDAKTYREHEKALRDAADLERIRLASSYGRALEEARAESAGLRERVADLEPGEACLVVMKEMADAMQ